MNLSNLYSGVRERRGHNCSGGLVLEKNEHQLKPRKPSIHLCEQAIYKRTPDINLALFLMRNEL